MPKITKEELLRRKEEANQANQIGWLDTVKMKNEGIKTSFIDKLTGYEKKENPFREGLPTWKFW